MTLQFKPAVRTGGYSRTALMGVSGSGKSYTGLSLLAGMGKRLAVIDTENRSLRKYLGEIVDINGEPIRWDALELDTFSPLSYVEALEAAAGYDAVFVDSLSHAWIGKGGQLEQVDNISKRSQSGNSFTAWRDVSPQHGKMVDALVHAPFHIVMTMRSKTEWVLEENDKGKKVPRKIGMQPIQKDGIEFECDFVGDMTQDHDWVISKSRLKALDKQVIKEPTAKHGKMIADWAALGVKDEGPPPPSPSETVKKDLLAQIAVAAEALRIPKAELSAKIQAAYNGKRGIDLSNEELQSLLDNFDKVVN